MAHTLTLAHGKQRQENLCEFQENLFYWANSRKASNAIQRNSVSKQKQTKTQTKTNKQNNHNNKKKKRKETVIDLHSPQGTVHRYLCLNRFCVESIQSLWPGWIITLYIIDFFNDNRGEFDIILFLFYISIPFPSPSIPPSHAPYLFFHPIPPTLHREGDISGGFNKICPVIWRWD